MAFSTIDKSSSFINTKLFTGTGATLAVTGVGFQPDLTWIKIRNSTGDNGLWDAVRGVTKRIQSNENSAETTTSGVDSFDADGFTMGTAYNVSSDTYASWNWKAGTTSGLSGGTITPSSYSFNTTSGFSILAYTGTGSAATIPHGLGVAPKMIFVKRLDGTANWRVYQASNTSEPATEYLILNLTSATSDDDTIWNDTDPTSSVFSVGTSTTTNASAGTFIAYCFADVAGYSKFGSYIGNGNVDGAFVYTGFKPTWLMIKRTDSTSNWLLYDNLREGYNQANDYLNPDSNNSEGGGDNYLDLLSNGFKTRVASQSINVSGANYIYAAFGQPIISNSGVCATAR